MSLDVYLRLTAAARGRAVPRATLCHTHLHPRPLVVAGYHLAGEPGAPLALFYGTSPARPKVLTVAEPRNRDQRFAVLGEFARDLCVFLAAFTGRRSVAGGPDSRSDLPVQVCVDAPQLVVPNGTTAVWLTDLLGRSLRYLRTEGDHAVDPVLPTAGAHLTWFATRRVIPGSATVAVATDLLTTHWVTGQLPAEDANLATLLAWICPPPGDNAVGAARWAELLSPAGPVSDPAWDRDRLREALGDPVAIREACEAALAPGWRHTWAAVDLLRSLPEAPHVARRWEFDRRAWTRHLDRIATDTAVFARRLDQLQSFRLLAQLEKMTVSLERQMALDDPLVMARHIAEGEALSGVVTGRNLEHWITLHSGRRGLRPLLRVRPTVPFEGPVDTRLDWVGKPGVRTTIVDIGPGEVTLQVFAGACRSPAYAAAILPDVGDHIVLATFAGDDFYPDNLPEELPWTHTS